MLTMSGRGLGAVSRGWVAVRDGAIADLGEGTPPRSAKARSVRSLEGRVLLPGFVDPHTHVLYDGRRYDEFELRRAGVSYLEILARGGGIHATVRATRAASDARLATLLRGRVARAAALGTTTLEVKSGYGLDPDEELRHLRVLALVRATAPIEIVPTFLALHALPRGVTRARFVRAMTALVPVVASERLAERVDAFVERGTFAAADAVALARAARASGLAVALHVDQLNDVGGAALAARVRAQSADHLAKASASGLRALARARVVAVLLPGSALVVGYAPPEARRFRAAGVRMALATDHNPGTSPVEGMPTTISLGVLACGMTPAEAIRGATREAARALGRADRGAVARGTRADLVVLDTDDERDLVYRLGASLVREVYVAGRRLSL